MDPITRPPLPQKQRTYYAQVVDAANLGTIPNQVGVPRRLPGRYYVMCNVRLGCQAHAGKEPRYSVRTSISSLLFTVCLLFSPMVGRTRKCQEPYSNALQSLAYNHTFFFWDARSRYWHSLSQHKVRRESHGPSEMPCLGLAFPSSTLRGIHAPFLSSRRGPLASIA